MTPSDRERSKAAARPDGAPPEDGSEVLAAALRAFAHLELAGVVGELLAAASAWSGARAAAGLVPDEEGHAWTVLCQRPHGGDAGLPEAVAALPVPSDGAWSSVPRIGPPGGPPFLAVPLRGQDGGGVAAVLLLVAPAVEAGTRIEALSRAAEPALGNARRVAEIRELTIRDDTADCFNRRHFEEFIAEELSRAKRFKSPLSLIFFDMDNLKEVNSRLGHAMGSRVLLEVSRRVRERIRRFDKLFRFGGDEFCVVLPETEWHGALEVAQRVREAIGGKPLLEEVLDGGDGIAMTASFGIASYPLHAGSKEELIQRSDRAMQSVKSTSKNGIAVAEMGHAADR